MQKNKAVFVYKDSERDKEDGIRANVEKLSRQSEECSIELPKDTGCTLGKVTSACLIFRSVVVTVFAANYLVVATRQCSRARSKLKSQSMVT